MDFIVSNNKFTSLDNIQNSMNGNFSFTKIELKNFCFLRTDASKKKLSFWVVDSDNIIGAS